MKAILLSNATTGGAGRAASRLQQGLQSIGLDAQMRVRYKTVSNPSISATPQGLSKFSTKLKLVEHLDAVPFQVCRQKPEHTFSLQWLSDTTLSDLALGSADVLNLHWVGHSYLSVEMIAKLNKPLVWTLHDMWAFTGGCHYNYGCDYYQKQCGDCPQLQGRREKDLSRWVWRRKARAWQNLNLTLVAPSRWLARCAQSSSLFQSTRTEVIPNGLDTQIYSPLDCHIARARLNLPLDKRLILFGAMSPTGDFRKGVHLLQPALQQLAATDWRDRVELVIFGASRPEKPLDFGFQSHYLGTFSDDVSLSLIYSAADVFIAPSLQDNLPNTVMEAITSGTPCVAFDIGGMPDMIEHQRNGYLAAPYEVDDLARGIAWILEDDDRYQKLSRRAREKAEQEFSLELQAKRYAALFEEMAI